MAPAIRLLALEAVRRGDDLLVEEGVTPDTGEPFYRLLAGCVGFGEHSRDAVAREFAEELDLGSRGSVPVGTFEQVFRYGWVPIRGPASVRGPNRRGLAVRGGVAPVHQAGPRHRAPGAMDADRRLA